MQSSAIFPSRKDPMSAGLYAVQDNMYSHYDLLNRSLDEGIMICDLQNAHSQNETK